MLKVLGTGPRGSTSLATLSKVQEGAKALRNSLQGKSQQGGLASAPLISLSRVLEAFRTFSAPFAPILASSLLEWAFCNPILIIPPRKQHYFGPSPFLNLFLPPFDRPRYGHVRSWLGCVAIATAAAIPTAATATTTTTTAAAAAAAATTITASAPAVWSG